MYKLKIKFKKARRLIMSLVKYNPFKGLSRMDRWFWDEDTNTDLNTFSPAVDIHESEKDVELRVEVPGLAKKDIKLEIVNGNLTISGEKKYEKTDNKAHRVESYYGKFQRSFYLGDQLDTANVDAEVKDGILKIKINKKEEVKPKQIEIK
jgi:HSP20 family protein